jgi:hypothetical protein
MEVGQGPNEGCSAKEKNIYMDWADLAQDRDQWEGSCEHGNEPSGSIKC